MKPRNGVRTQKLPDRRGGLPSQLNREANIFNVLCIQALIAVPDVSGFTAKTADVVSLHFPPCLEMSHAANVLRVA